MKSLREVKDEALGGKGEHEVACHIATLEDKRGGAYLTLELQREKKGKRKREEEEEEERGREKVRNWERERGEWQGA